MQKRQVAKELFNRKDWHNSKFHYAKTLMNNCNKLNIDFAIARQIKSATPRFLFQFFADRFKFWGTILSDFTEMIPQETSRPPRTQKV